jgi:hypothetical protein
MHAVRVGVGVNGMGVLVFVGIGVGMVVLSGDAIRVGAEIMAVSLAVSFFRGASDGWMAVDAGVTWIESRGTCPQACKRTAMIHTKVNPLRTLAVYHNKPRGCSKLSPSECRFACNPIHSFTGKIAQISTRGEINAKIYPYYSDAHCFGAGGMSPPGASQPHPHCYHRHSTSSNGHADGSYPGCPLSSLKLHGDHSKAYPRPHRRIDLSIHKQYGLG